MNPKSESRVFRRLLCTAASVFSVYRASRFC